MGLEMVEIIMEVEETFGIQIPDDETAEVVTPGDLYDLIVQRLRTRDSVQSSVEQDYGRPDMRSITWDEDHLWAKLQQIIADVLGIQAADVTREAHFLRDLGCG